jgi:hypothetical protein
MGFSVETYNKGILCPSKKSKNICKKESAQDRVSVANRKDKYIKADTYMEYILFKHIYFIHVVPLALKI